jgi:hypothetical protein
MAKMERMVRVLPRPMRLRMMEKRTMNQTALTGVPVWGLIWEKKLCCFIFVSDCVAFGLGES